MAVALAIGLLMVLPAGPATARSRRHGPSPRQFVASSILVHNSFANIVSDEFAGPFSNWSTELERCHRVEAMSGEEREDEEKALVQTEAGNIKVAESLQDFNSRLPLWVKTLEGFGSRLGRAGRKRLAGAVGRLAGAHAVHAREFYDLKGVWVQIESVGCAEAERLERDAEGVGTPAWTKEFRALVEVAHLFHVRTPPVEYPVGPYVEEVAE